MEKQFPNGFTSWSETHHEVVSAITQNAIQDVSTGVVNERIVSQGQGGLYELGEELTDEFEKLYEGKEWDGEFYDAIEAFLKLRL